MKNLAKYIIKSSFNIRRTIKQMDNGGIGFIVIVDYNENVKGVVADGDFRRAILNGIDLERNVLLITNKKYKYIEKGYSSNEANLYFKGSAAVEYLPVLEKGKLIDIISKDDLPIKDEDEIIKRKKLDLPVVIMAGGKGTRLDPFTRILPKALIPIGEKPIIEVIMDEYAKYGIKDFYISVNHKGKMIKAYFEDHSSNYNFNYLNEDKSLGTAGALKFLEGKLNGSFFVSNCDIIIKGDYSKILKFHKDNNYDLTLVGSVQHYTIPYGVCLLENSGLLKSIQEKPVYDYLVNTGMYILNSHILSYIPENTYFDMTNLIDKIQNNNHNVGVFPVSEKSWIDVGQWEEYKKTLEKINLS